MKEKLTKNDSMCKGAQDFEVLSAVFNAMLSRNDIRLDYYAIWAELHPVMYGSKLYNEWHRWAKDIQPKYWTLGAFDFSNTHIPTTVWVYMHSQWLDYLKAYLKK